MEKKAKKQQIDSINELTDNFQLNKAEKALAEHKIKPRIMAQIPYYPTDYFKFTHKVIQKTDDQMGLITFRLIEQKMIMETRDKTILFADAGLKKSDVQDRMIKINNNLKKYERK